MLHEEFLETELFAKKILHSSSFEVLLQQKQLFCIEFPSLQSSGLDVVRPLQKDLLGSIPPTNWVKF